MKALKIQAPFNPKIPAHLDVPLLERIIKQCDSLHTMKHGTWKSDAIWTYLSSTVALAFQHASTCSLVPTWAWVAFISPVHCDYTVPSV